MDLFDSAIRAKGDLAGAFEYGDLAGAFEYDEADNPRNATAYFYLYRIEDGPVGSVIDAIHIRSGDWAITEADISVRWDKDDRRVGLFIFGTLWATFDTATGTKHGGGYGKDFQPDIP